MPQGADERTMRWLLVLLLGLPLGAQAPFTIVSVDRQGLPPYEPETRIYRLDGGRNRGLKAGEWLTVRRAIKGRALGRLRVESVGATQAGTSYVPAGDDWPMKGDQAWPDPLLTLPPWPSLDELPSALPPPPVTGAIAPPREGLIYFLPRQAEVSPAGREKVAGWVKAWGVAGKWAVQLPGGKAFKPALQQQRAEALLEVLRENGVATAEVQQTTRTQEGPNEASWVLHWD